MALSFALFGLAPLCQAQLIRFGSSEVTYDGTAHAPLIETTPLDLPVSLWFENTSSPSPEITAGPLFNTIPSSLALSYSSLALPSQKTAGLGDFVRLRDGFQKAESVDVVLVNWAKAEDWPEQAELNPEGFVHPITISTYRKNTAGALELIVETTSNVLIPWRPTTLPNGKPYPHNGYAFTARIPFATPIDLPQEVFVMVSYNIRSAGFKPLGVAGPYDVLNIGLSSGKASVGSDLDTKAVLWVTDGIWSYPATGFNTQRPMFSINGTYLPARGSSLPPVASGTYDVTATVSTPLYTGSLTSRFVIKPAEATIHLSNLIHAPDGLPKTPDVVTTPPGLPVRISYNGEATPPAVPGEYTVAAEIDDPNYRGSVSSTMLVGLTVESWRNSYLSEESSEALNSGLSGDSDKDGLCNLLEYAFGFDPAASDHEAGPKLELSPTEMKLIYRRNNLATDLNFLVEGSCSLDYTIAWEPVVFQEKILRQEGNVEWVEVAVPIQPGEKQKFLRIRVSEKD